MSMKTWMFVMWSVCVWATGAALSLGNETNSLLVAAITTDSDADGMTDWDEEQAGTNPIDPNSRLVITDFQLDENLLKLNWLTCSGGVYQVVYGDSIEEIQTSPTGLLYYHETNGVGPWRASAKTVHLSLPGKKAFFAVRFIADQSADQTTAEMAEYE